MKNNRILNLLLLGTFFILTACIREEAPNAECDIIAVNSAWLDVNREIITGRPSIANKSVSFNVVREISLDSLKTLEPIFDLTPGASIEKLDKTIENGESGIIMYYRTMSEDGMWSKEYEVSFTKQASGSVDNVFSFENYALDANGKFYTWYEIIDGTRYNWWASSNEGYKMTNQAKVPEDFPTSVDNNGVSGNCVRLKTCDTGSAGGGVGMPIAAGSIFIGEFQGKNAMSKPLEATRFGLQIASAKPLSLKGHYKYTAGEIFTDKNKNVIEGKKDTCSIYAVLYEVDPDNFISLCGTDVMTSERVVLLAELKNPGEPTEWTEFEIPFEPMNGKEFDQNKLVNNEYAITVVASSSKNGGTFEGAVGSTLYIDELKITWEKSETSNAECNIIAVNESWLKEHRYIIIGKPEINNKSVNFNVVESISIDDLMNLDPIFDLSAGARIEKIGTPVVNGDTEVVMQYKTHSEDEKWSKEYKITFTKQASIPVDYTFGFENFSLDAENKFYTWYECIKGTHYYWWASSNEGYKLTGKGDRYSDFPASFDGDGVVGCCVKLKTCETGIIGKGANIPLAAGSIYLGEFLDKDALKKPLKATQFGLQILPAKPVALNGFYKYTAGEVYTDKNKNIVENQKDSCAIYAVLYEVNPENVIPLNGTNITTSNSIVLFAELKNPVETTEWQEFNIPFEAKNEKEFDYEKLINNEYAIAIVATSSKNGNLFEGAIGSTLYIDEFKLIWEE